MEDVKEKLKFLVTYSDFVEGNPPADTRRRFSVYKTPIRRRRRRIDIETRSCVYWAGVTSGQKDGTHYVIQPSPIYLLSN